MGLEEQSVVNTQRADERFNLMKPIVSPGQQLKEKVHLGGCTDLNVRRCRPDIHPGLSLLSDVRLATIFGSIEVDSENG